MKKRSMPGKQSEGIGGEAGGGTGCNAMETDRRALRSRQAQGSRILLTSRM